MNSPTKDDLQTSSEPKRRRLGTRRTIKDDTCIKDKLFTNFSPPDLKKVAGNVPSVGCASPSFPCNQMEYLSDSGNNPSEDIYCYGENIDNVDRLHHTSIVAKGKISFKSKELSKEDTLLEEMFSTKLIEEPGLNCDNEDVLTARCDEHFKDEINEGFEAINQSIIEIKSDKDVLFETKDSFLLDIEYLTQNEKGSTVNHEVKFENDNKYFNYKHGFYQLPIITEGLFKTYRKIDKLYDWQEECLNLDAIHKRRNLIYALPTSGGKTLVAEILMLREVLNRKHNVLFILPFVALVQEKIWSLSPFAVQLDFLVEEYAAGKGHLPPKKRRTKNSIYVATIEKGLALIRSLTELDRLHEIGLIVVDELHLIGEEGRGATLETLLASVIFSEKDIQIVGMSATIGNLEEVAEFLRAEVFQRQFRPVELTEYVKLGDVLHRILRSDGFEVVPDRQLKYDYTEAASSLDPDMLGGLVAEVVPASSCLVFCPTKNNCENVASLLCKMQRKEMVMHRAEERAQLAKALKAEGGGSLPFLVSRGVAFHHAGLSGDERALLEGAFRGVVSVLCCTSTLAAGVNLPARRVIIRAPLVGRDFISLAAYRQMVGRAGRAGVCDAGESVVICGGREWGRLREVLAGGLAGARSVLGPSLPALLLPLAPASRGRMRALLACTLLAVTHRDTLDMEQCCDDAIRSLLKSGALELTRKSSRFESDCPIPDDTEFAVSKLGSASIKACMDLKTAKLLLADIEIASKGLILVGSLHLLYLVTPQDAAGVRPDYRSYHSMYSKLDEEGVLTARRLGITDKTAIRMMTGKAITDVPEVLLRRFYLAMMLHEVWKQMPLPDVAERFGTSRGALQAALTSSSAIALSGSRLCEALERWPFASLLSELAQRLQRCNAPHLHLLMELPAVKKARALQLTRAGYKRVEDLAKATADNMVSSIPHLSKSAATHLISAAKMMLIEKVENLRAEAEEVMDELR